MNWRPRYRLTEYKGYYYRYNAYKNCYEIGKYQNGKWEIWWTADTESEAKNDIDEEIALKAKEENT
ncbi:MAG: hypothetical protein J6U54_16770 [Clostridiales bacterium]|nr:hypothetical protein [Clostridiales bacterium]